MADRPEVRTKEGMFEAYVFVHRIEGSDIDNVKVGFARTDGVRFVAQFVGAFVLFGRVVAPELTNLQSLIKGDYWKAGIRSDWSLNLTGGTDAAPKRNSPDICALVRAQAVGDPFEIRNELDRIFSDLDGFGAAVVTGRDFDLLVDLPGDSVEGVVDRVVQLRDAPGIGRTATAIADLGDNAIRP